MKQAYNFTITIGFRTEADNEHDALDAALTAEESLNEASLRAIYGTTPVYRVKAPQIGSFKPTKRKLPDEPVTRSISDTIGRKRNLLSPLSHKWTVALRWRGKDYQYTVNAPTRAQAVEKARIKCYHETSHLGTSLVSIQQEK